MSSLLKNAVDSTIIGLEDFFASENDARRILSSIRNLYAGLVLSLKAELGEFDENMLFEKYEVRMESGDPISKKHGNKTVNRDELSKRMGILGRSSRRIFSHLSSMSKIRNDIEHYYTDENYKNIEPYIMETIYLLREFKLLNRKLNEDATYLKNIKPRLYEIERKIDNMRRVSNSKWEKVDFEQVRNRIFPSQQSDNEDNPDEVIFDLFSLIKCPKCYSDIVEPVKYELISGKEIFIEMKCHKSHKFLFKEIIVETLEKYYSYEISKVGAKGGLVPISYCPKCKIGCYLNYEKICINCGNIENENFDTDYDTTMFSRNVCGDYH